MGGLERSVRLSLSLLSFLLANVKKRLCAASGSSHLDEYVTACVSDVLLHVRRQPTAVDGIQMQILNDIPSSRNVGPQQLDIPEAVERDWNSGSPPTNAIVFLRPSIESWLSMPPWMLSIAGEIDCSKLHSRSRNLIHSIRLARFSAPGR
ncbi:hypothetical protein BJ508DRAFT_159421 [Ascobolus immersus RN42]|uniref:Secreted protein n=1 Tax=Ascobolus immersus RN42 TaxID=1160509 RepID=A0A3N4IIV9_ASCIM|nr:hypothetical protein BJ508DRAFT_159421 [Ascobolus immersus RN42]